MTAPEQASAAADDFNWPGGQRSTRLTLIRHGQTAWNQDGRIQGHIDIALNAHGQRQAQAMAQALADEADIACIYSSDLARAWQTAQALQARLGKPLQAEAGLRERCFGQLQGLSVAQICAQDPQRARAFQSRDPDYQPPQGESLRQFAQRAWACVWRLAAAHAGQHIALVTHGGVLDVLYRQATGLDLQAARSWSIENTSIHRLLCTPQGLCLLAWGDVAHLDALPAPQPGPQAQSTQHFV